MDIGPAQTVHGIGHGGNAGRLLRDLDFASTPLGPATKWPQSLRTTISLILASGHPMCLAWGPDLTFFYNDAYEPFLGGRHPMAMGQRFADVWSDVWSDILPLVQRALAGETVTMREMPLTMTRHGYPEETWWSFSYSPVFDEAGAVAGMLNVAAEVTGQVLNELRSAGEREQQRLMLMQMPGFAALLSGPEHRFEYVNDAYREIAGDRAFFGRSVKDVFPEIADQGFYELLDRVYATGEPYTARAWPITLDRVDGERFIDFLYQPIRDGGGCVTGIFVGGYDVTEQVRSAQLLHTSETRYHALFETIDAGFCVIDVDLSAYDGRADYRVIEANPAFYRQTGFTEAILGRWLREAVPGLEEHWFETYAAVARTGEPIRFEQGSDALGRWFDVYAFRLGEATEHRAAILFNDISERRRAEDKLLVLNETLEKRVAEALAERRLLAELVERADVLVQVVDLDFRWLAINDAAAAAFERHVGIRPRVGQSMIEALGEETDHLTGINAFWSRALAGEEFTVIGEFDVRSQDRRSYEMKFSTLRDEAGNRIGAYQFAYDVTLRFAEQRRLAEAEEALRQSQKMEAMGQLTGGVAHDFNNLLTPIVGILDRLGRRGIGDERDRRLIAGAAQSAERATLLVHRLLAFARRQPLQAVAVDVGILVEGMADLIESTCGPQIRLETAIERDLPLAVGDPNQLEMALLNLAVNARDAMGGKGVLTISAMAACPEPRAKPELKAGRYIRLVVADTGIGMDKATMARAVEPFFSTKGVGRGTGLGLSMAHGLAAQLGGILTIDSIPGEGTTIALWLPESSQRPAPASTSPGTFVERAGVGERGTALLVDDEEIVRLAASEMLNDLGYKVIEATSGEEALALLDGGSRIDVVVSDHLMPGMTGSELARALRDRWPDLPVLIVSGYAEAEGVAPDLARLTKPFRTETLAASLSKLIQISDR